MFYSIQYRNGCSAASELFHMFTQSLKFYTLSHIKKHRFLKTLIHQIDWKNERLLLSESFTAKFELVFVLTLENSWEVDMLLCDNLWKFLTFSIH